MEYKAIVRKLKAEIGNASLMAVSKTRTLDEIKAVYDAGVRLFGENHVAEIVEKFSSWHPDDVEVHMIGHLQTNKVAKAVPLVDMIDSVDSIHLLEKINSEAAKAGKVMPFLFEVNTSGEDAKSGFRSEDELFEAIEASLSMSNVCVKGLMTVGPVDCKAEEKDALTRKAFAYLASLGVKCAGRYPQADFSCLSMGMSGDYAIGVKEGATVVRIGTLIFGERHYV